MTKVPRRLQGVDLRTLPLTPSEGYVWSRVDGKLDVRDLSRALGLDQGLVGAALEKLAELKAIEWLEKQETPQGDTDLAPAIRERVEKMFARLDELDHYQLLGIARTSDRRTIKDAYFQRALEFHPDKHFGKKLGEFGPKLEAVFMKMTQAHDVLTVPAQRTAYDATLPVLTSEEAPPSFFPDPEAEGRRREAAARKFLGDRFTRLSQPPSSPPKPAQTAETAKQQIQEHFAAVKDAALTRELNRHLTRAREAESVGDLDEASQALRKASLLLPDRDDLRTQAEVMTERAIRELAERNAQRAMDAVKEGDWGTAALMYLRAAAGRPDDDKIHERAAFALLMSGTSLRRAAELAQKAVELVPDNVEYRITLVRAMQAANMPDAVRPELEKLRKMAPKDPKVKELYDTYMAKLKADSAKGGS